MEKIKSSRTGRKLLFLYVGGEISVEDLMPGDDVVVKKILNKKKFGNYYKKMIHTNGRPPEHVLFTDVIDHQPLRTRYVHGHVRNGDAISVIIKRQGYRKFVDYSDAPMGSTAHMMERLPAPPPWAESPDSSV